MGWRSYWKRLSDRRKFRRHYLFSFFGKVLLAKDLWHVNRHSLAGGVALGLFVGLTPTIPFHMVLAALGAVYFRVYLPAALAACWVSNPLTIMPLYTTAWKVGQAVLIRIPYVADTMDPCVGEVDITGLLVNSMYLWTGFLLFATTAALISWGLIFVLWRDKPAGGDRVS